VDFIFIGQEQVNVTARRLTGLLIMNLHHLNPNQKGYQRRIALMILGRLRKLSIKWGLFLAAMIGISITFISRFSLAIALLVLSYAEGFSTGLFHAYEKLIAVILSIII